MCFCVILLHFYSLVDWIFYCNIFGCFLKNDATTIIIRERINLFLSTKTVTSIHKESRKISDSLAYTLLWAIFLVYSSLDQLGEHAEVAARTLNGAGDNWEWCPQRLGQQHSRVVQEFLSTKREYAKKRGVTKLVAPRCVACSTEGEKESPFSLQKEMRDFASRTCEKAKRSNPCKLGRNPRKKREVT